MALKSAEGFQLREPGISYPVDFGLKNDDIEAVDFILRSFQILW